MNTPNSTSHRLHEIGRPECVAEGCEPVTAPAPTLPPYTAEERALTARMGGGRRAAAAAERMVAS